MRTVMVFGTFDGIHDGHRAFLTQARELGDHLIVAVAEDAAVEQLKKRTAQKDLQERMGVLADEMLADRVVAGDEELGTYDVVKRYRPDVIALGYDQTALKNDLMQHLGDFGWYVEVVTLLPHKPETHHSSLRP